MERPAAAPFAAARVVHVRIRSQLSEALGGAQLNSDDWDLRGLNHTGRAWPPPPRRRQ